MKTTRRSFLYSTSAAALGTVMFRQENALPQRKTRQEIEKEINEIVDKFLPVYNNCAQTSFYVLNQVFDLRSDNVIRALGSLPGIALRGETCGTVSGCLCAISLVYSDEKPGSNLQDKPSFEFCRRFENEFGTTRCRDVIEHVTNKKYTIEKPEDYGIPAREGLFDHCFDVVKKATGIAADIIFEKV